MSDSQHIERIIREYFAAMTAVSEQPLELSAGIELSGPMLPEPLHGFEAVTEHLQQIAPFITQTEILEIVIDRNSAAVRVLIHTINGACVETANFFRIYQGQISRVRSLFDTRKLLQGGSA